MKTEDLMVGDLVKLSKGNWSEIRNVNLIDIEMVAEGVYLAEPIPLTPEILEKNGFITNDKQGNWNGYRIYSLFNTNKSCIFMLKLYEKDSIVEISLDMSPYYIVFKFVHQLQHALKLCGIEKEIVL